MKTLSINPHNPNLIKYHHHSQKQLTPQTSEVRLLLIQKHPKLREHVIAFLVKACDKYNFSKDTLFLAIKIMDLLIESNFNPIHQDQQLTAASLVILTTKYNQVYPVTIDKINLLTEKYYPREKFFEVQGQILECLNFEIPQVTVYSELYNQMKRSLGKIFTFSDSEEQNHATSSNRIKISSQKVIRQDPLDLVAKTLKTVQQPQCFKYGQQLLTHALLSYVGIEKTKGSLVETVKVNYLKTIIKKIIEPEKCIQEKRKTSILSCLYPNQLKVNPEKKQQKRNKIFIY